jgi:hypothetical protein
MATLQQVPLVLSELTQVFNNKSEFTALPCLNTPEHLWRDGSRATHLWRKHRLKIKGVYVP